MGIFSKLKSMFAQEEVKVEPKVEVTSEPIQEPVHALKPKPKKVTSVPSFSLREPNEGVPRAKTTPIGNPKHFDKFYSMHRTHQREACVSMESSVIGQVCLPTGTGKTRVQISEHIKDMLNSTKKGVYVIGAHRLLLCRQLLNDLLDEAHECGLDFDILFVGSSRVDRDDFYNNYEGRNADNCKVTYTTSSTEVEEAYNNAQTSNRHLIVVCTYHSFQRLSPIPTINVCTYDEAHTLTSSTFQENIEVIKPRIEKNFFFTATRKVREGGEGGMDDTSIFGEVLYEAKPREMIDRGEIVAPRLHIIKATESGDYENHSMHIRVVQQGFIEHKKMLHGNSTKPSELGAKLLISTSGRKELFDIYHNEDFQHWCKENKIRTFAFSSSQEADEGYFVDGYQVSRQEAFKLLQPSDFKNPKGIKDEEDAIIFHIEILTEGIDLPSITGVMPFRSLEAGKLFQTLGRASRLLKADRKALYGGDIKPNELDKYIKPYAYLILPEDFRHLVNYNEMKAILRNVMNQYEIPLDQLVVQDEYLADSSEPPKRVTPLDSAESRDSLCNLKHIVEDIICDSFLSDLSIQENQRDYINQELNLL